MNCVLLLKISSPWLPDKESSAPIDDTDILAEIVHDDTMPDNNSHDIPQLPVDMPGLLSADVKEANGECGPDSDLFRDF